MSNFRQVCRSGNYMLENQHEEQEQCGECFGRGEIEVTADELHAKLYGLFHDHGYCAKLLFAVYRLWKIHPYTTCDMCNGHGEITRIVTATIIQTKPLKYD